MGMRYIIDRFEGRFAVLEAENGEYIGVERARLPDQAQEGSVVLHELGRFTLDQQATQERRALMREKLDSLWKKGEPR